MSILVWDERRPGSWDQCSECGYLMGLVHGGGTRFPKGAYTAAERDAFTATEKNRAAARAAGKAMFPLLDEAALRRYGHRLRSVSGSITRATDTQLRAALSRAGNAVVLPGKYTGLGFNHPLRARARQANGSDYIDGHMVTVVNDGGHLGWLDPLRYNGEAAYPCTVADAMAFARPFGTNNSDAHVVRLNEFRPLPDTAVEEEMDVNRNRAVASAVFKGGTFYKDPDRKARYATPLKAPTRLEIIAVPRVTRLPDGRSALVAVIVDNKGGPAVDYKIAWLGYDQIDQNTWQPVGWTV